MIRLTAVALAIVAIGGCNSQPLISPLGFSGLYATTVTLGQNSCGAVTVQNNNTNVVHNSLTGAVTLTHAGQTYSGTVASNGSFTTTPKAVNVGDGFNYSITIAGQFVGNTLTADVTVDRTGQGSACQYIVHWTGVHG